MVFSFSNHKKSRTRRTGYIEQVEFGLSLTRNNAVITIISFKPRQARTKIRIITYLSNLFEENTDGKILMLLSAVAVRNVANNLLK